MASPANSFKPGSTLDGRYRLESILGEGGVGQVFRARHLKLGNEVAIKVLQTQFENHSAMRPRFVREAQAMAALKHPHIIAITDFQTGSGPPYIVMELLEGLTLRETMELGPFSPARARRILEHLLDALSYAHGKGFVHRDLKPDNIFLLDLKSDDAFPKILDFGFVKLTADAEPVDAAGVLTRSGIAFGTPAYMSPEQATGAPAEPRSDLYSLGIVFFEMLAGRRPYEGSLPEIVRKHLTAPVPSFAEVGAAVRESDGLRRLFQRAMGKEPKDRFSSASEMKQALMALPDDYVHAVSAEESSARIWAMAAPTLPVMARTKRDKGKARSEASPSASASWSRRGWLFAAALSVAGLAAIAVMRASEPAPEESSVHAPENSAAVVPQENGADEPVEASPEAHPERAAEPAPEEPAPEEPAPEELAPEELAPEELAPEEPAPEEPAPEEPAPDQAPTIDPWEETSPAWITRSRRRTSAGRTLSTRTEDALKRYARAHRDDPRPHLLLAHSYCARGWDSSALERFGLAQRVSPSASADPQMRSELVRLSARSTDPARAAAMVVSIYGADALDAVGAALEDDDFNDEELARLRQLQASLR